MFSAKKKQLEVLLKAATDYLNWMTYDVPEDSMALTYSNSSSMCEVDSFLKSNHYLKYSLNKRTRMNYIKLERTYARIYNKYMSAAK